MIEQLDGCSASVELTGKVVDEPLTFGSLRAFDPGVAESQHTQRLGVYFVGLRSFWRFLEDQGSRLEEDFQQKPGRENRPEREENSRSDS